MQRTCSLFLTKVLRPPPQRVGRLTNTITLPRAVPAPQFFAAIVGGVFGMIFGSAVASGFGTIFIILACAMISVWIIGIRPWKGEHIGRVGLVKLQAWHNAQRLTCPGSFLPVTEDAASGSEFCSTCGLICDVVEDSNLRVAGAHQWKREVYMGCQRIKPEPLVTRYKPGSISV